MSSPAAGRGEPEGTGEQSLCRLFFHLESSVPAQDLARCCLVSRRPSLAPGLGRASALRVDKAFALRSWPGHHCPPVSPHPGSGLLGAGHGPFIPEAPSPARGSPAVLCEFTGSSVRGPASFATYPSSQASVAPPGCTPSALNPPPASTDRPALCSAVGLPLWPKPGRRRSQLVGKVDTQTPYPRIRSISAGAAGDCWPGRPPPWASFL